MYSSTIRTSVALLCVGSLSYCFGGGASIGIAMINGTATVDNANVRGNASILEGSVVETGKGSSQLSLEGGARINFGSESRGKIYRDHVVLEKGFSQLHAGSNFPVLANSLSVVSMGSDSTVRISVKDAKSILVGAVSGEAQVRNSHGLLLAKVMPGRTMEFDQEAGAAAQATASGCVTRSGGKFYLSTDASGMWELTGAGLAQYVGKHVDVTGSTDTSATPTNGATQVVRVASSGVTNASATGCATSTKPVGGGAGGAAAGGLSTGAIVAVVGGVAVASILGGLAATGEFSGDQSQR